MSAQPPRIPWPHCVAALFVGLSGGTLAAFALAILIVALQGGMEAMPFALMLAPFLIAGAIIPALLAGLLLRYQRWLRLSHFLAAGGASGAVVLYAYLMLAGGVAAVQNGSGLIVLAFFAGVAGGASAWAYLKLKQHIPSKISGGPAP